MKILLVSLINETTEARKFERLVHDPAVTKGEIQDSVMGNSISEVMCSTSSLT